MHRVWVHWEIKYLGQLSVSSRERNSVPQSLERVVDGLHSLPFPLIRRVPLMHLLHRAFVPEKHKTVFAQQVLKPACSDACIKTSSKWMLTVSEVNWCWWKLSWLDSAVVGWRGSRRTGSLGPTQKSSDSRQHPNHSGWTGGWSSRILLCSSSSTSFWQGVKFKSVAPVVKVLWSKNLGQMSRNTRCCNSGWRLMSVSTQPWQSLQINVSGLYRVLNWRSTNEDVLEVRPS